MDETSAGRITRRALPGDAEYPAEWDGASMLTELLKGQAEAEQHIEQLERAMHKLAGENLRNMVVPDVPRVEEHGALPAALGAQRNQSYRLQRLVELMRKVISA